MSTPYENLEVELGPELARALWDAATSATARTRTWLTRITRWRGVLPSFDEHRLMIVDEAVAWPKRITPEGVEKLVSGGEYIVRKEIEQLVGSPLGRVPLEVGTEWAPVLKPRRRCGAETRSGRECLTWVPCRHHP